MKLVEVWFFVAAGEKNLERGSEEREGGGDLKVKVGRRGAGWRDG